MNSDRIVDPEIHHESINMPFDNRLVMSCFYIHLHSSCFSATWGPLPNPLIIHPLNLFIYFWLLFRENVFALLHDESTVLTPSAMMYARKHTKKQTIESVTYLRSFRDSFFWRILRDAHVKGCRAWSSQVPEQEERDTHTHTQNCRRSRDRCAIGSAIDFL